MFSFAHLEMNCMCTYVKLAQRLVFCWFSGLLLSSKFDYFCQL
jgi:hypothetical protein